MCAPGKYSNTLGLTACIGCEAGKYTNLYARTSCDSCPIGRYTSTADNIECTACARGKFGSNVGLSVCANCTAGQESVEEASVCTDCNEGFYAPVPATSECKACQPGTSNDKKKSQACTDCQPGRYSGAESTVCANCQPGSYSDVAGLSACVLCPEGFYNTNGGTGCTACLEGKSSPEGATSCPWQGVPTGEPTGQPSSRPTTQPSTQPTSLPSSQPVSNPTSVPTQQPTAVPTGRPTSNCPAGYYFLYNNTGCVACEPGKASSVVGSFNPGVCTTCGVGRYAGAGLAECIACPLGSFLATRGAKHISECKECPRNTYADSFASTECIRCPAGTITPDPGAPAVTTCTNPEVNFYTAIIVLVFTFFGAVDYIGNGRFQRIAFLRRERVTKRLLFLAKSIVTYLDNYRYKAEADRVYVTRRRVLRVIAFYFVSVLLFAIIIAVRCIAVLFTIIFKGLIILAGLQIKLPYIEKIDHLLRELGNLLHLDFLYFYLLYPFSLLMQALAWIQIEVVTFNVTCTGATAPLKLFFNVIIMGLIMIMTQSEYQLFSAISQTSLSNKFSFVITTPSYRNKTLYPPRNQWEALKRKAGFSMEYIRVLLVTLVSILSERFDFLRTLMQFVVSFVNLSDFVRANGYMHEYDASCNAVKGFEDFDKYLALIASVFAWIIFFPALYEVSNILIPGTIPGMPVVKTSNQDSIGKNFKKDGYVRKVYSGFRGLWRSTSVYAVDLWWAEGFKKWLNFMCTHSPYEINVPAPMLARARDLSFEATTREDDHLFNPDLIRSNTGVSVLEKTDHEVTTKLSISMLAPHSGEEWNRIIDDAENNDSVGGGAENGTSIVNSTKSDHHTLDEIAVFKGIMVRNKKANKVMEVLEMPVLPTFRVALGRDDVDASSVPEDAGIPAVFADAISDALAMSRDKAIFFTCKRALIDSYRWSIVPGVQTKSASFRGSGACFTLIRILGSTGEVDFSGIFDFSLPYEYPGGPEAMMHALNDSTSGHVIVLYTHGFIYPLEVDPTNANNEGKTDFDWAEVRAQEAASIKEKLVSSASKNRLGEVGVARHAMEQQEMIEAIERCGGNADILSKATAYVLIGVPECGKSQGHQCFCTIDDKERTIYCSTRGQPKVSMGSALLGPDSKISELLVDVQFSIMNGQSVNFPLDWEILNSPYVQEKQLMCFKSDSFITSPLHTASEQENRKWLLRIKNDLPSYFSILKMEYMEMSSAGMWAVQLVIPAGLFTDLVVLPLANLISFIFAVFCLGHVFTYVGRRVWYMVGWKYLHFCLLCFGVWTETLVQMMKVHEFANIYSLILSHPSVKIKDLYKKAGIDWKETGVRGATLNDWSKGQAESEDGDDDGGSLKSEGQPRTTTTSEPVWRGSTRMLQASPRVMTAPLGSFRQSDRRSVYFLVVTVSTTRQGPKHAVIVLLALTQVQVVVI